jgi:hypothetical protein
MRCLLILIIICICECCVWYIHINIHILADCVFGIYSMCSMDNYIFEWKDIWFIIYICMCTHTYAPPPICFFFGDNLQAFKLEEMRRSKFMRSSSLIASRGSTKPHWLMCMGWINLKASPQILEMLPIFLNHLKEIGDDQRAWNMVCVFARVFYF